MNEDINRMSSNHLLMYGHKYKRKKTTFFQLFSNLIGSEGEGGLLLFRIDCKFSDFSFKLVSKNTDSLQFLGCQPVKTHPFVADPEQRIVTPFSCPLFRPWKRRTARFRRTKTICFASNVTWGAAWNSYLPKWKPSIKEDHSQSAPHLQSVPVTAPTPNQVGHSIIS